MIDEQRLLYLGALGLLCECSVYVPSELRESIKDCLKDACSDGSLQWREVLGRLEIEPISADSVKGGTPVPIRDLLAKAEECIMGALRASGPLHFEDLVQELLDQCPGIDRDNAAVSTAVALGQLVKRGMVEQYGDSVAFDAA